MLPSFVEASTSWASSRRIPLCYTSLSVTPFPESGPRSYRRCLRLDRPPGLGDIVFKNSSTCSERMIKSRHGARRGRMVGSVRGCPHERALSITNSDCKRMTNRNTTDKIRRKTTTEQKKARHPRNAKHLTPTCDSSADKDFSSSLFRNRTSSNSARRLDLDQPNNPAMISTTRGAASRAALLSMNASRVRLASTSTVFRAYSYDEHRGGSGEDIWYQKVIRLSHEQPLDTCESVKNTLCFDHS